MTCKFKRFYGQKISRHQLMVVHLVQNSTTHMSFSFTNSFFFIHQFQFLFKKLFSYNKFFFENKRCNISVWSVKYKIASVKFGSIFSVIKMMKFSGFNPVNKHYALAINIFPFMQKPYFALVFTDFASSQRGSNI